MESEIVDKAIQRAVKEGSINQEEYDAWQSLKKSLIKYSCDCSKLVGHVGYRWHCLKCDTTYSG